MALSSDQQHILLRYGEEGSWTLLYNLYADKLLGLDLVDPSVSVLSLISWILTEAIYADLRQTDLLLSDLLER